jgi:Family of unknown function (DUF5317)
MISMVILLPAVAVALLRGGSLMNLVELRLRWVPLVLGALAVQLLIFTPFRATPLIPAWTTQLYMLSMALLTLWVALNWRIAGMALMALGLLANFAAIAANGGYMPVAPESARYAGRLDRYAAEGLPVANNSIATGDQARLWLLTDILPIPAGLPFANVYSVGDVLLTLGGVLLCYHTIRKPPVAAPATSAVSTCPQVKVPQGSPAEVAQRLRAELIATERQLNQDLDIAATLEHQAAQLREHMESRTENQQPTTINDER